MNKLLLTLACGLIGSLLTSPVLAQEGKLSLSDVAWIAGCWKAKPDAGRFNNVEFWSKPVGNAMLGTGAELGKTGKITSWEHMKIEAKDDGKVVLTIRPHNKPEASFTLSDGKAENLVFENPKNDFPQKVIYRREKDGSLEIRVDGKVKDVQRAALFPMVRTPCE
jgi:hypothetical protein